MEQLTSSQSKALNYIKASIDEKGSPPTLRELCGHMGYKAIGSAQDVITALRKKGFLEKAHKQAARALKLSEKAKEMLTTEKFDLENLFSVPCLGSVPAGNPLEAIEERIDTLNISSTLLPRPLPKPEQLFALKTSGDSMIDAGIHDGDWLVVKVVQEAEPGSIVVARLQDGATCKRLMNDLRRGWYLKPENTNYKKIFADENSFEVVGKVVALQRTL